MELHDFITALTAPTNQMGLQVYSHQVEIFTRLITYLAVVSVIMWACVVITMLVRLAAQKHYHHSRERLRKRL
jgi:hypothetical protein